MMECSEDEESVKSMIYGNVH